MDGNGHSWLAIMLATAVRPSEWPLWIRQVLGGAAVVLITSFAGTSLALWREQAVIVERIQAVTAASVISRQVLQEQVISNDRDIEEIRRSVQRAYERISAHTENHVAKPK